MAQQVNLQAGLRSTSGKGAARSLRREGKVPAVIYGHGREPESLVLDAPVLAKALQGASAATVLDVIVEGRAPVKALLREVQRNPVRPTDVLHVDLYEIHEAFAGQVLSTVRAIESADWAKEKLGRDRAIGQVDPTKLNVNGGSLPLGHPFGATGGRLILQALHELRNRKKNLGLISICAAGGLGLVMVVEAV